MPHPETNKANPVAKLLKSFFETASEALDEMEIENDPPSPELEDIALMAMTAGFTHIYEVVLAVAKKHKIEDEDFLEELARAAELTVLAAAECTNGLDRDTYREMVVKYLLEGNKVEGILRRKNDQR